jgi:hypothetical protein
MLIAVLFMQQAIKGTVQEVRIEACAADGLNDVVDTAYVEYTPAQRTVNGLWATLLATQHRVDVPGRADRARVAILLGAAALVIPVLCTLRRFVRPRARHAVPVRTHTCLSAPHSPHFACRSSPLMTH